jgi:uracil-DNA glycosylase
MNPTAKNVSANPSWSGIRAPWLGTKNIWKMFNKLNLITPKEFDFIQNAKIDEWTPQFSESLYTTLSNNKIYVSNLAKCTQPDARPLRDSIFKNYLSNIYKEISLINPQKIVTFGNQVSSILLGKPIKVSNYENNSEILILDKKLLAIYPTFYPVGQGMRNMDKAVNRIKKLIC